MPLRRSVRQGLQGPFGKVPLALAHHRAGCCRNRTARKNVWPAQNLNRESRALTPSAKRRGRADGAGKFHGRDGRTSLFEVPADERRPASSRSRRCRVLRPPRPISYDHRPAILICTICERQRQTVTLFDKSNSTIGFYPATAGSQDKPSSSCKVTEISRNQHIATIRTIASRAFSLASPSRSSQARTIPLARSG